MNSILLSTTVKVLKCKLELLFTDKVAYGASTYYL